MLVGAVALLLGCGDDELTGPISASNNGGTGNQTLAVQALVSVEEVTGGFLTDFRVTVSDREGEPVGGAQVIIEGGFGPITLTETDVGDYRSELTGAAWGTLSLRVEKDSMFVRDVVLGNIGIHTFISPQPADTVEADAPLMIRWFRDAQAPVARLSTRDVTLNNIVDSGEFVLADSLNPERSSQRFELLRSNEVQISGGLRSSYFRIEVRNSVEPVVVGRG